MANLILDKVVQGLSQVGLFLETNIPQSKIS
jgi:hypothetical protein